MDGQAFIFKMPKLGYTWQFQTYVGQEKDVFRKAVKPKYLRRFANGCSMLAGFTAYFSKREVR